MQKTTIYFTIVIVFAVLTLVGWFIIRGKPNINLVPSMPHTSEQAAPAQQDSGLLLENESEAVALLGPGSKDPSRWEQISDTIAIKAKTASQVAKVVFYLDRTIVGEDTAPAFTLELDTTAYEDCMYILRVKA